MRTISIILLSLFVLLGCGRKGALFLPPQTTDQQVAPEQTEKPGKTEQP
ncbi:MAG: lipoprotein [Gallionella sp.]